jgi:hypothetical protein
VRHLPTGGSTCNTRKSLTVPSAHDRPFREATRSRVPARRCCESSAKSAFNAALATDMPAAVRACPCRQRACQWPAKPRAVQPQPIQHSQPGRTVGPTCEPLSAAARPSTRHEKATSSAILIISSSVFRRNHLPMIFEHRYAARRSQQAARGEPMRAINVHGSHPSFAAADRDHPRAMACPRPGSASKPCGICRPDVHNRARRQIVSTETLLKMVNQVQFLLRSCYVQLNAPLTTLPEHRAVTIQK